MNGTAEGEDWVLKWINNNKMSDLNERHGRSRMNDNHKNG